MHAVEYLRLVVLRVLGTAAPRIFVSRGPVTRLSGKDHNVAEVRRVLRCVELYLERFLVLLVLFPSHFIGFLLVPGLLTIGTLPASFGAIVGRPETMPSRTTEGSGTAKTGTAAGAFGYRFPGRVPPYADVSRPAGVAAAEAVVIPGIQFAFRRRRSTPLFERWLALFHAAFGLLRRHRSRLFLRLPAAFAPGGIFVGACRRRLFYVHRRLFLHTGERVGGWWGLGFLRILRLLLIGRQLNDHRRTPRPDPLAREPVLQ